MILAPWFYSAYVHDASGEEMKLSFADYMICFHFEESFLYHLVLVFLITYSLEKTIFFFLFHQAYTSRIFKNNDKNYITIYKNKELLISIPYLVFVGALIIYSFYFIQFYSFLIFNLLFYGFLEYKDVLIPYAEYTKAAVLEYWNETIEKIKNHFKIN